MADKTVSIRLLVNDQEYAAKMKRVGKASSGAFDDATKNATKQRKAMDELSTGFGIMGAAAVAGAGIAVKKFADFDKSMSAVKATGDDARGSMEQLRKAAIKAGADTAFSATEAAGGMENLLKAGVSAKDVLGGGLSGALDLAAAGQLGVADAAETAATAMTQFKLEGKDVPHIADLLAAGAGKAQGEVSDMAMALKQSGLVASQFGLSIEDTTGTLGAFASAGLIGSDAGTSFKTMLLALANPAEKTRKKMEELGIAAYDANGNFVGITNLAEQLKTKLGGLDQATRDQALAQIFGNDAIRAANVLYDQGASGIQGWIDKVNDAGYAQRTAATLLDNLSGDIEAFTGSLETALIGVGEGADGPLRSLVQKATDAVNAFSEMPDSVQSATLALAGGGGLVLLGVAGMGKLVVGISEAKSALTDLGVTGKRVGGALKFSAIIAAAGVLATAASEVGEQFSGLNEDVQDVANSLEGFANKGKLTGAAAKLLGDDFDQLLGYVDRLGDPTGFQKFTNFGGTYLSPFRDNVDLARMSVEKMDQSLVNLASSGGAEDAAAAFEVIKKRAAELGVPVEKLRELFPQYTAVIRSTTEGQKALGESAGGAAGGVAGVGAATEGAVGPTENYKSALQEAADQASALREQADLLYDSLRLFDSATLSAEEASIAFRDQIRGMAGEVKALKEQYGGAGTSLKANTAAGDANRKMLLDGVQAAERAAKATFDKSVKTKGEEAALRDANAVMGQHIQTLRKEAERLDLNRTETDKYIAKILGVPVKQITKFTAPGLNAALADTKKLKENVDGLKSKSPKMKITLETSNIPKAVLIYKGEGGGVGMAGGGLVHGPGTGTSDSIPKMLSRGEFVVPEKDVARNLSALEAARMGATLAPIDGMAKGGIVRSDTMSLGYSTPGMTSARTNTGAVRNAYEHLPSQVGKMVKDWMTEAAKATMAAGPGGPFPGGSSAVGTWRGKRYTHAMIARLMKAERLAGTTMYVSQGGFRPTTSYSGTTHNKDAVDVGSPTTVQMQNALRAAGIAAWIRTPSQGPWSRHIHGVPMPGGGVQLSNSAYQQTQAYLRGGDGLRGYDKGGWLMPGLTMAYNGTGKPERVIAPPRNGLGATGGDTYHVKVNAPHVTDKQGLVNLIVEGISAAQQQGRTRVKVV